MVTADPREVPDSRRRETDPYLLLPEVIRTTVSRAEYLFMTDAQKAGLIEAETEPEY